MARSYRTNDRNVRNGVSVRTGNIIRNFTVSEHGWDCNITIRAVDEEAYQQAQQWIRYTFASRSERARQDFLSALAEKTGSAE